MKNNLPYADIVDGKGKGISFDIWDHFAKKFNIEYELVEYLNFAQAVEDVSNGVIDLALGPFSLTEKRYKIIDYSRPYTLSEVYLFKNKKQNGIYELIKTLIPFFIFLLVGIFVASRVDNENFLAKLAKGFVHFFQYSYIIENPTNNFHFFFNIIFSLVSFIFSVFIIGFILNFFATSTKKTKIGELTDTKVGYEEGTYYGDVLEQKGIIGVPYTDKFEAIKDLKNGVITAWIDDYYVLNKTIQDMSPFETTELFRVEEYAIIYRKNWKYSYLLDRFMIESRENGLQKEICMKNIGEQNIFCFL